MHSHANVVNIDRMQNTVKYLKTLFLSKYQKNTSRSTEVVANELT